MWHVKDEIAPAVLLVVDFGGWYRLDSRGSNCTESGVIPHTQVSVIKDVIVPYTHLLPRLDLSQNKERHQLLYFKGAKHRHRVSIELLMLTSVLFMCFMLCLLLPSLILLWEIANQCGWCSKNCRSLMLGSQSGLWGFVQTL